MPDIDAGAAAVVPIAVAGGGAAGRDRRARP